MTNLLYFLYLVSRTLLLKLQYCRVNANNTNKQEQEIKNKENSKREKEIRKVLLFYLIKKKFSCENNWISKRFLIYANTILK